VHISETRKEKKEKKRRNKKEIMTKKTGGSSGSGFLNSLQHATSHVWLNRKGLRENRRQGKLPSASHPEPDSHSQTLTKRRVAKNEKHSSLIARSYLNSILSALHD
jgi:hypothetical protein